MAYCCMKSMEAGGIGATRGSCRDEADDLVTGTGMVSCNDGLEDLGEGVTSSSCREAFDIIVD